MVMWALDFGDDKVVYLPKGDPAKVKFYCQSTDGKPNRTAPVNSMVHSIWQSTSRIGSGSPTRLATPSRAFLRADSSEVEVFLRWRQRQGHGDRQQGQRLDDRHDWLGWIWK